MYKIVIFFFLALASFSYAQEEKTFALADFNKLTVIGNFSVEVMPSSTSTRKEAVVNIMDETVEIDKLSFTYEKGELVILYKGSFIKDVDIYMTIYYPESIQEITARRGAEIRVNKAGNFGSENKYKVENGGKLLIKDIVSPKITAEISKGGSIRITGKTDVFSGNVSMGGTLGAVELEAKNVEAKVSMGGEITCLPIEGLDAKVTSGGSISYKGSPAKFKEKISLGGTIEKL